MPGFTYIFFRGLVLALMTAHVFYMYSLPRTSDGSFGISVGLVVICALFAGAMMIPMVWAVGLAELPEIYVTHVRAKRRWKHGRCPACDYVISVEAESHCPECGRPNEPPVGYQFTLARVRRFVLMGLAAWLGGMALSEVWITMDEVAFEDEAKAALATWDVESFSRQRTWPNQSRRMEFVRDEAP